MRHETAIAGPKTQIQKFQLSFFAYFFSFNNKNTKIGWKPMFLYCFNKPKNQNLNLKRRKLKNPIFAPFFDKRQFFGKLPDNWAPKKTQNDN